MKNNILIILIMFLLMITVNSVRAEEPVTINFWHAMDGVRGDVLNNLIEQFNKEHSDIKVVGKFVGITDYTKDKYNNSYNILFQQLLINISTFSPPDVAQVYENWTSQFISINSLVPVEKFINMPEGFSKEEQKDFVPTFLEPNRYDGKLWTLPFNKSIYVLYYNKELFMEKGIKPPANWEELALISKEFTKHDETGTLTGWGLSFKADVDTFSLLLLSSGGDLISTDGNAVFNSEKGEEAISYLKKLIEEGGGNISFDPMKDFTDGKCAMFLETTSKIASLDKNAPFQYGIISCPSTSADGKVLFAGTNLAIFKNQSEAKEKASWEFIKWLTNTENTVLWSIETGYIPVRTSAIESDIYKEFLNKNDKNKVGLEELGRAVVAPRVPAWQSIRGIIDDTVFNSLVTEESVSKALNNAAETANKFLN